MALTLWSRAHWQIKQEKARKIVRRGKGSKGDDADVDVSAGGGVTVDGKMARLLPCMMPSSLWRARDICVWQSALLTIAICQCPRLIAAHHHDAQRSACTIDFGHYLRALHAIVMTSARQNRAHVTGEAFEGSVDVLHGHPSQGRSAQPDTGAGWQPTVVAGARRLVGGRA